MDRRDQLRLWTMLILLAALWPVAMRLSAAPNAVSAMAENDSLFSAEVVMETPAPTAATEETATPAAAVGFLVEVIWEEDTALWAGKRVLIYHSHTYEAYEQVAGAEYVETEKWRTKDESCNVVAVGKALAAHLTALGVEVVHDTTAFEPPDLDDAYGRSLQMLEERIAAGEQYDLIIDLHRDALSSQSTIKRTVVIGGEVSARFMVLIGKGTTGGYTEKPDWETNLVIAQRITDSLNAQVEGIARDVKIKTGRFNQHIAPCCVLLECGVNTNTLEEVLTGLPYLAQAIAEALGTE